MAKRWIVTIAVGSMLWAGCAPVHRSASRSGSARESGIAELSPSSRPPVADLPVPQGFELEESASRSFAEAGNRYVDHLYTGRADKYNVARFYKRYMPISRWTLTTDMFIQGRMLLDFEKEGERCRIMIDETGMMGSSKVQAQVWSRGRVTMTASTR
jgi:hypothetical protein